MYKEHPVISIITPAYNSEKFISKTIESVVSQTFNEWEMIIVDDCSIDNTVKIVSEWSAKDPRIKLLENLNNLGPGPARNLALDSAKGRYIAFLDSDDQWVTTKLAQQVEFIQEVDAPMVFSSYGVMDEEGKRLGKVVFAPDKVNYQYLLGNTVIGCLTVLIDSKKVMKPRMPAIPSRQPLVLWLKILKEVGDARGLDEVLAWYRVRPDSISSNKWSAAKQVWKVYREYEKLSFIKSAYFFSLYAKNSMCRNLRTMKKRF